MIRPRTMYILSIAESDERGSEKPVAAKHDSQCVHASTLNYSERRNAGLPSGMKDAAQPRNVMYLAL